MDSYALPVTAKTAKHIDDSNIETNCMVLKRIVDVVTFLKVHKHKICIYVDFYFFKPKNPNKYSGSSFKYIPL